MKEHELLWDILPEGLEAYFDLESYEKTDNHFRITLIEKNRVPDELPKECRNKPVINTILKPITLDCFPIKGRKGELILKRRCWQFKDVERMVKREINVCAPGTKLEKEFGDFLKEFGGDRAGIHKRVSEEE
ncbi:MAG TPA: hypothetical protein VJL87_04270 [Bdellovibrionota bacterium]|nr:hypothetical protein [Bdellovibrionota bacterium]